MQKLLINILFFFSLPTIIQAQATIKGIILENTNDAIPYSIVTLKQISNAPQSPNYSTFSDSLGVFYFTKVSLGNYVIEAAALGFTTFSQSIIIDKDSVTIEPIQLTATSNNLSSVTIIARKRIFEKKIDRLIFNIENSPIATSSTIWEALPKISGVRTTSNGNITANGKSVNIYINNRPMRLSPEEVNEFLKNLPANNTARIEVITNPPASYEAQSGAIINIIDKKNLNDGVYATLRSAATFATYPKYTESCNFSIKNDKLNLFGHYIYGNDKDLTLENGYVKYPNNYWDIAKRRISKRQTHDTRVGIIYQLAKKHVMGAVIEGYNRAGNIDMNAQTDVFNQPKNKIDSMLSTHNFGNNTNFNYAFNVNYTGELDTNGRSITTDFDYAAYKDSKIRYVLSNTFLPNNNQLSSFDIRQQPLQNIYIYTFKTDYTQPISIADVTYNAAMGIKFVHLNTANNVLFEQKNGLNYQKDITRSNDFKYNETVQAIYLNLSGSIGKWETQLGIRGENTHIIGNSVTLGQINDNTYFKLFPSLFLQRVIKENHTLSFSYSRRINRPRYSQLNPFRSYSSPFYYYEGNPFLLPEDIHSIDIGYSFSDKYVASLLYNNVSLVNTEVTIQDNTKNILVNTYKNLEKSAFVGIALSANNELTTWWDMNASIQLLRRNEIGIFLDKNFNRHLWYQYLSINNSFTLSQDKTFKGELNAWYGGASIQGINNLGQNWELSFGLRKTFHNKRGRFGILLNDIFYTNIERSEATFGNQYNGNLLRNDTRSISFNLSYLFGNSKVKKNDVRPTSNEEERKRAIQ
jgi:hypothetical protein